MCCCLWALWRCVAKGGRSVGRFGCLCYHATGPVIPCMCVRREEISVADVEEVHALFHDAKYTAQLLTEQADKYIQ